MVCIGGDDSFEAVEDLGNILKKLPSITSKDRASVAGLLNSITFTEIEPQLQAAVREEITNFLNGRSPTLAPIPEERSKTVKSQSAAEPKVPRLDFSTLEEKKIAGPKLPAVVRSAIEPTIERPSSSAAKKSADPQIKETTATKSGAPLFSNNFAKLLETMGKGQAK